MFAVPSFVTLPSVAIDISDTAIKYITLEADAARVAQCGTMSVPAGILERGRIVDVKACAGLLRQCCEKAGTNYVRIALPEEQAYLFETEVPRRVSNRVLRNTLEFRLTENVPLPAKEVLFDYTILPQSGRGQATMQVAVTAYAREVIQEYYAVCTMAGCIPTVFELEAHAIARSVVPPGATGATMVVDLGKTRTGIAVVYQGVPLYTTTFEIGGDHLSGALRKALGSRISEKELVVLKHTQGLTYNHSSSIVCDTLISTLSVIKDEIVTNMRYWHARTDNEPERRVSQVILCGGTANLRGLPAYLTNTLLVPVRRAQVWDQIYSFAEEIPPVHRHESYRYAAAVGLALGSTRV